MHKGQLVNRAGKDSRLASIDSLLRMQDESVVVKFSAKSVDGVPKHHSPDTVYHHSVNSAHIQAPVVSLQAELSGLSSGIGFKRLMLCDRSKMSKNSKKWQKLPLTRIERVILSLRMIYE